MRLLTSTNPGYAWYTDTSIGASGMWDASEAETCATICASVPGCAYFSVSGAEDRQLATPGSYPKSRAVVESDLASIPAGSNTLPPGFVAKPDAQPCRCRGSGHGIDSCGDLCCAASPYTDVDPKGKYYYKKGGSRSLANLCFDVQLACFVHKTCNAPITKGLASGYKIYKMGRIGAFIGSRTSTYSLTQEDLVDQSHTSNYTAGLMRRQKPM